MRILLEREYVTDIWRVKQITTIRDINAVMTGEFLES